jgi:Ribbon-helix-helix domain
MPTAKQRKIKTALYVAPKQIEALKKIAARLDVPMSQLIREGINLAIQKYKK